MAKSIPIPITHLVHKAGTAELGREPVPKNLTKPFLVMIIAITTWIINAPNVKHSIKAVQHLQTENKSETGRSFTWNTMNQKLILCNGDR